MDKVTLTIIRGLPGSGKTTTAIDLAWETGAVLIDPDFYLHEAPTHYDDQKRRQFARMTSMKLLDGAARNGSSAIFSAVITLREDVEYLINEYRKNLKQGCNLQVDVIDMPLLTVEESLARNIHGSTRKEVKSMVAKWQPWEGKE